MTGRMWVEAWSPEYGTSYGIDAPDPDAAEAPEAQAVPAEDVPWAPITPATGELPPVAFLDGVSRVDARVFLEAGGELVAGLCGSVGVGAMKTNGTTRFGATRVHRALVMPAGQYAEMPFVSQVLTYESRQATGSRPEDIRFALEALREEREGLLAALLADEGFVVIADGRLRREAVLGHALPPEPRPHRHPRAAAVAPAGRPAARTPPYPLRRRPCPGVQRCLRTSWSMSGACSGWSRPPPRNSGCSSTRPTTCSSTTWSWCGPWCPRPVRCGSTA